MTSETAASKAPPRKIHVRPLWLVGGLLWGAALFVLLQQYAVFVYSDVTLLLFALIGLVIGLVLPNVTAWLAARRHAAAPTQEGSS